MNKGEREHTILIFTYILSMIFSVLSLCQGTHFALFYFNNNQEEKYDNDDSVHLVDTLYYLVDVVAIAEYIKKLSIIFQ